MQQNSENIYNFYVKLLLGQSLFSFLIQFLNGNKYRLTYNFGGTGLKFYSYKLLSVIVRWYTLINYARNWSLVWVNKNFDPCLKRPLLSGHSMTHQAVITLSVRLNSKTLFTWFDSFKHNAYSAFVLLWMILLGFWVFFFFNEKIWTVFFERFLQVNLCQVRKRSTHWWNNHEKILTTRYLGMNEKCS